MASHLKTAALPMAILVYAFLAFAIEPAIFAGMVLSYFEQAIIMPVLLVLGVPIAAILARDTGRMEFILELVRTSTFRLLIVVCLFCIGTAAFTTFKIAIPKVVPFYADQFLADTDAWLHNGNPGEFVHAIIPAWAEYPLGFLYGPVWFMLWFGFVAFIALQKNAVLRTRYFWSMALTVCLLGTVAAAAFSSVGPIFYAQFVDPDRYADLVASIKSSAIGDYMGQASGYLLANYQSGRSPAGAGISAMPSMHLAIVTLNACMLASLNRVLGFFAWLYVALILLGSVFLGWHYALDGYFSIVFVALIWWLTGLLSKRNAPRAAQSGQLQPAI